MNSDDTQSCLDADREVAGDNEINAKLNGEIAARRRNEVAALETLITIVEKYYRTRIDARGLKVRPIEKQPVRFFFFFLSFDHLMTRYRWLLYHKHPCHNEACTFLQTCCNYLLAASLHHSVIYRWDATFHVSLRKSMLLCSRL